MQLAAGMFIKSTSLLNDDPHFAGTIIYLTECNEKGVMGFVINQQFERNFNELVEFSSSPALPLWTGGPVATDKLFFIHRRADVITGSTAVKDGIYYGGDFVQAVKMINRLVLTNADLKLFIGYCGWDKDELEAEIEEGSWEIVEGQIMFY